jgi:8-oxo-dGTP pyrophosphatase MutT (NUDIX family)
MKKQTWKWLGIGAYWALLPLIYMYAATTKPRARVLLVHENQALVVKNWLGAGGWALPGGGIEPRETPAAAAIREVKEELGFLIEPGALKPLGQYTSVERGGLRSRYHLFVVELTQKPQLLIKTDEITDHAWLSLTDLAVPQKGVGNTVTQSVEAWLGRNVA